jgi:hypothetical protein
MSEADLIGARLQMLGPKLGEYYHNLWRELNAVDMRWHELTRIFGQGPEVVDLVNHVAPMYFIIVVGAQWREIVIAICAFSDKATIGGNSTVSFRGLRLQVKEKKVQQDLMEAICRFEGTLDPLWIMRDKSLAHWDEEVVLGIKVSTVTIAEIQASLVAAGEVLVTLEKAFDLPHYDCTHLLEPADGTTELLRYLAAGKKAIDDEDDRLAGL